jgi:hypothetical protein
MFGGILSWLRVPRCSSGMMVGPAIWRHLKSNLDLTFEQEENMASPFTSAAWLRTICSVGGENVRSGAGLLFFRMEILTTALLTPKKSIPRTEIVYTLSKDCMDGVPAGNETEPSVTSRSALLSLSSFEQVQVNLMGRGLDDIAFNSRGVHGSIVDGALTDREGRIGNSGGCMTATGSDASENSLEDLMLRTCRVDPGIIDAPDPR